MAVRNAKQAVLRGQGFRLSEGLEVKRRLPMGLRGYKGEREGSTCTAPPAVINGIRDATGIWIKGMPAKPEKVFWASKEEKKKNRS